MGQKTALGSLLKAIGNSGQGKVVPGWGAVPVMTVIGLLLLVFLVILLQIYNQSLLLQGTLFKALYADMTIWTLDSKTLALKAGK